MTLARRWQAAAILGLLSSSFSTIVAQLTAGRLGRDALVDWMVVGSIALRDLGLQTAPTWWTVLAGLIVHQSADFSWDIIFFFVLSRWSHQLSPWALLGIALPWAIFTSAIEWLFLVPVLPFWWALFTLQQAWWLGLLVHLTAASTYPLFPYVRDCIAGVKPSPHRRFAWVWGSLAVIGTAGIGATGFRGRMGQRTRAFGRKQIL
jgi:hypothetical protein